MANLFAWLRSQQLEELVADCLAADDDDDNDDDDDDDDNCPNLET